MSTIPDPRPKIHSIPGPRQQFLETYEEEHRRTMRVLRAFPAAQLGLRPHPQSRSAHELAWIFVVEQALVERALTTGFDFSKPMPTPAAPDSFEAILEAFDRGHRTIVGLLEGLRDDEIYTTVQFFTGPGTIGDVSKIKFLWFILHDQIHHRGQFTVYLRMAGGKVPAIYGPSLDEPWV